MADKKTLVEEALLQMENLQEAITENAKGILASTMKEEISELVKESLKEEGVKKSKTKLSEQEDILELDDIEVEDEDGEDEMEGLEDLGLEDLEMDSDNDEDLELGDEEMLMIDLPGDELEVDDEEEVLLPLDLPLDLTGSSDDDILKVFKAMGEDDGIIVTQDEEGITLKDDEADVEYEIRLESEENEEALSEMEEEEIVYEIEIGEENDEEEIGEGKYGGNKGDESRSHRDFQENARTDAEEKGYKDGMKDEKEDLEKGENSEGSIRSHVNGRMTNKKPQNFPKSLKRESLEREVHQLREKNEEYRKALNIFKEKLNEVAVFNSNLAYATRLFTEHSTTKKEKINILRRFDGVETIKESKSLYKSVKEHLGGNEQTVVAESVQSKVQKSPSNGSANNLIESKTYENPQFLRMKDLMGKLQ
tara:strand:+ start:3603 stop:4868 length:1266 start_codon:yes stop_codon:yes gene_type:complete